MHRITDPAQGNAVMLPLIEENRETLEALCKKYYVANGLTNDLTIIDVESLKAEKSVPVGRLPWGVAVMP